MATATLSDATLQTLARMREEGARIYGPGPVTRGATTPTADDTDVFPGMHVQIAHRSRFVDGFGIDAEGAVRDALMKLGR
ncbi:MAG: hypothetical protein AB7O78_01275 [Thermoleophilia bacterium]